MFNVRGGLTLEYQKKLGSLMTTWPNRAPTSAFMGSSESPERRGGKFGGMSDASKRQEPPTRENESRNTSHERYEVVENPAEGAPSSHGGQHII